MPWPVVFSGSLNPNYASTAQQAFSSMLAAIYRADQPLYDQDDAFRRDPDAWAKMLRDPVLRSLVEARLAAVARQEWNVEPGDDSPDAKRMASIVEQLLRRISNFGSSRKHLAQCVFLGYAPAWIEGRRQVLTVRDGKTPIIGNWWTPTYLRPLDKRQFRWHSKPETLPDGTTAPRQIAELWLAGRGTWETVRHPECLILAVYGDDPSRLGYGRGLGETLYSYHWIKGMVLELGLAGLEKWANGILLGKVSNSQQATAANSNVTVAAAMLDTLAKMRTEGAVVVDKEDEISVVTPGTGGQEMTSRWLGYLDDAMARLVLNSVLPTGGGSDVGSLARAETEERSTDAVYDADRALLDEELTQRLVSLVVDMNEPMWTRLGLLGCVPPRFSSRGEQRATPATILANIKLAQEVGMEISRSDAHELTQFPMPEPGADVLKPAAASAPSGGGFGMPPGFALPSDEPPASGQE